MRQKIVREKERGRDRGYGGEKEKAKDGVGERWIKRLGETLVE